MPLDEMTIAGMRDCVSCFDSCADAIVRKRSVQNAQSWRSCRACSRRSLAASCAPPVVRRLLVAVLRLQLRIELVDALGVAASASAAIGLSTNTGSTGIRFSLFEPLDPVEQLLDAADRERRDDQLAAALGRLA